MNPDKSNLVWIDLEMTGLDTLHDEILEAAVIVTDSQLDIIAESPSYVIFQTDEVLGKMNKWNQTQHTKTGLIEAVRQSDLDYAGVEKLLLAFLSQHAVSNASPMCGNSICQDRRFLFRLMPRVEQFFHYRNLDVSSIKELAKRWAPDEVKEAECEESSHRALDDIRQSINELKHYREVLFLV